LSVGPVEEVKGEKGESEFDSGEQGEEAKVEVS